MCEKHFQVRSQTEHQKQKDREWVLSGAGEDLEGVLQVLQWEQQFHVRIRLCLLHEDDFAARVTQLFSASHSMQPSLWKFLCQKQLPYHELAQDMEVQKDVGLV